MAKIFKFLVIFFIITILHAGDYDKFFKEFDTNFSNSSKIEKQDFHNKMKNLYLQSSVKKNKKDRIGALQRLIYSSKILDYNSQSYERELQRIGGDYNSYLKTVNSKVETIEPKKQEKPQTIKQQSFKPSSTTISQNKTESIKKSANEQKSDKNIKLKLISAVKNDGSFLLEFNRAVDDNEMKRFVISDKNNYRNVVDFKALNTLKIGRIKNHMVDEIRIAQFDKDTTRIVFNNKNKFNIDINKQDKYVTIGTNNAIGSLTPVNKKSNSSQAQAVSKKNKKNKIIVLDAGHGGKDPGAMGNGLKEKDIVLSIVKKTGGILKNRGYVVHYTRNKDIYINLKSRTAFANKKNADMFVSVHTNAAPNSNSASKFNGIETFFLSPARSERSKNAAALENKGDIEDMNYFSQQTFLNFLNREKIIASNKLAIDIQKHLLASVKRNYSTKDSGVREAPFWVLVGAQMPAVLIETGYITHPTEGKNMGTTLYQNRIAEGIANGIDAYFAKNK